MSYAKGRSVIAQKERVWARKRPGTMNGTVKYLAENRERKRQAGKRKFAWIELVVAEFHAEQRALEPAK